MKLRAARVGLLQTIIKSRLRNPQGLPHLGTTQSAMPKRAKLGNPLAAGLNDLDRLLLTSSSNLLALDGRTDRWMRRVRLALGTAGSECGAAHRC